MFASTDSLVGLPERGRFATETVSQSFLIIRVTLEKLTSKPSPFSNLKYLSWVKILLVKKLDWCSHVIGNFWYDYHKSFNGNDCLMRSTA